MDYQTFLTDLPPEILINILSRLPIKTIINCKCVRKPWLDLLKTQEFITSHLSKSTVGLIVNHREMRSQYFRTFEFEDELELEHDESRYKPIMKWDFPNHNAFMEVSVNGLLCLRDTGPRPSILYICNPVTSEYIELTSPEGVFRYPSIVTYGFGMSKRSGQYKVVRIFHECERDPDTHRLLSIPKSECQVYTLGTGSWRSINPPGLEHEYSCRESGVFLNGKLHWIVSDLKGSFFISCFDLETEVFRTLSLPTLPTGRTGFLGVLSVLGVRLCFCDNTCDYDIVIWVMKEYGVEKSWTKEHTIRKSPDHVGEYYVVIHPMKVFKDGDILMFWDDFFIFYYSDKTKSTVNINMFELQGPGSFHARLHVSSFVSLKSFTKEVVKLF